LGASAFDQHIIVQFGRTDIADLQVGNCIGALARFNRGALVDLQHPQHVGTGAFEPAQVIGVIDYARKIGVFVIHPHRKVVERPVEAAVMR
jgi:hypothetical protein